MAPADHRMDRILGPLLDLYADESPLLHHSSGFDPFSSNISRAENMKRAHVACAKLVSEYCFVAFYINPNLVLLLGLPT